MKFFQKIWVLFFLIWLSVGMFFLVGTTGWHLWGEENFKLTHGVFGILATFLCFFTQIFLFRFFWMWEKTYPEGPSSPFKKQMLQIFFLCLFVLGVSLFGGLTLFQKLSKEGHKWASYVFFILLIHISTLQSLALIKKIPNQAGMDTSGKAGPGRAK